MFPKPTVRVDNKVIARSCSGASFSSTVLVFARLARRMVGQKELAHVKVIMKRFLSWKLNYFGNKLLYYFWNKNSKYLCWKNLSSTQA